LGFRRASFAFLGSFVVHANTSSPISDCDFTFERCSFDDSIWPSIESTKDAPCSLMFRSIGVIRFESTLEALHCRSSSLIVLER
jgi:hypothetical protein